MHVADDALPAVGEAYDLLAILPFGTGREAVPR